MMYDPLENTRGCISSTHTAIRKATPIHSNCLPCWREKSNTCAWYSS